MGSPCSALTVQRGHTHALWSQLQGLCSSFAMGSADCSKSCSHPAPEVDFREASVSCASMKPSSHGIRGPAPHFLSVVPSLGLLRNTRNANGALTGTHILLTTFLNLSGQIHSHCSMRVWPVHSCLCLQQASPQSSSKANTRGRARGGGTCLQSLHFARLRQEGLTWSLS